MSTIAKGTGFLIAVTAGVCLVFGAIVYFDEDLRRRVQWQMNEVFDEAEQAMNISKSILGRIETQVVQQQKQQDSSTDQWSVIDVVTND